MEVPFSCVLYLFLSTNSLYGYINLPVKGAFALGKKIVKVSFPGVAVQGSRGVGKLRCGGVTVWGSRSVGELECREIVV